MIYLDNASTTKPNEITMNWLRNYNSFFGNPSNIYSIGREMKNLIEESRNKVAKAINASSEDIYFTSGTSESNAWAVKQRECCYCSPIEHHSLITNEKVIVSSEGVLTGFANSYAGFGYVISHMLVNNETGDIYTNRIKELKPNYQSNLLHTDATQAIGNIFVDVKELGVDMLSLSGHKFHAPKGIGVLYINHNTVENIKPLIYGSQENNYRGGTENTLGILCLGDCIEESNKNIMKKHMHCKVLKAIALSKLESSGLDYRINSSVNSVASILNFSLKNVESEVIASILSDNNIYIGVGSACNTGDPKPSYVLESLGVPDEYIRGSIRLSFDIDTTVNDVETTMKEIFKTYRELKENN